MHPLKRIELAFQRDRKTASAVTGGILFAGFLLFKFLMSLPRSHIGMPTAVVVVLALLGLAAGVLMFTYGFAVWREKRTIENIPTSRVRSLAMGLVEVSGQARPKALLKSPITASDCVYYKYLIEKHVHSGKSNKWVVVDEGASTNYFFVDDGTGKVLVDPVEADIHIAKDYRHTGYSQGTFVSGVVLSAGSWGGHRMRYTEWRIAPGDQVYAMGTVKRWKNTLDDRRFKIAERLRLLKEDRERMKQFDTDGDGQVDAQEWELARARIEQDVLKDELANPIDDQDSFVITRDPANPVMILSDFSEKKLALRLAIKAWLLLVGGAGLIAGMAFLAKAKFG